MSVAMAAAPPSEALDILLRTLRLPSFLRYQAQVACQAEREGWSFGHYLAHLAELEVQDRNIRRTERRLKESGLPRDKSRDTLELARLPDKVQKQLEILCEGSFVRQGENLLLFGLPGRGKSHLASAIGLSLIDRGYRVCFTPTFALVQKLLVAKRELRLEKVLAQLDVFDLVILDDLGYVQQDRDEMEVLFTFFAERYERKSIAITSNLVFSQWDRIFHDPMTTAAAIDRLVHHAIILEMTGPSFRAEHATKKGGNNTSKQ